jgi:catechol 2,3-dioxygenase-like lactoylglutathione lyase family enzyme
MAIKLAKDSIDIGIVVKDAEKSLAFYRDTIGLEFEGELPMGGGGKMHRLKAGTTIVKLVSPGRTPPSEAAPGGINGAYGYRYWTMIVENLEEVVASIEAAGYKIAVPISEFRPGTTIAIVEDPDGNWVEFVKRS